MELKFFLKIWSWWNVKDRKPPRHKFHLKVIIRAFYSLLHCILIIWNKLYWKKSYVSRKLKLSVGCLVRVTFLEITACLYQSTTEYETMGGNVSQVNNRRTKVWETMRIPSKGYFWTYSFEMKLKLSSGLVTTFHTLPVKSSRILWKSQGFGRDWV